MWQKIRPVAITAGVVAVAVAAMRLTTTVPHHRHYHDPLYFVLVFVESAITYVVLAVFLGTPAWLASPRSSRCGVTHRRSGKCCGYLSSWLWPSSSPSSRWLGSSSRSPHLSAGTSGTSACGDLVAPARSFSESQALIVMWPASGGGGAFGVWACVLRAGATGRRRGGLR